MQKGSDFIVSDDLISGLHQLLSVISVFLPNSRISVMHLTKIRVPDPSLVSKLVCNITKPFTTQQSPMINRYIDTLALITAPSLM